MTKHDYSFYLNIPEDDRVKHIRTPERAVQSKMDELSQFGDFNDVPFDDLLSPITEQCVNGTEFDEINTMLWNGSILDENYIVVKRYGPKNMSIFYIAKKDWMQPFPPHMGGRD